MASKPLLWLGQIFIHGIIHSYDRFSIACPLLLQLFSIELAVPILMNVISTCDITNMYQVLIKARLNEDKS